MSIRVPTLLAVLLALASVGCTSSAEPVRTGYTRPDCPQDYLTGPKFIPCYTQR